MSIKYPVYIHNISSSYPFHTITGPSEDQCWPIRGPSEVQFRSIKYNLGTSEVQFRSIRSPCYIYHVQWMSILVQCISILSTQWTSNGRPILWHMDIQWISIGYPSGHERTSNGYSLCPLWTSFGRPLYIRVLSGYRFTLFTQEDLIQNEKCGNYWVLIRLSIISLLDLEDRHYHHFERYFMTCI